jgi:hypothetical protein
MLTNPSRLFTASVQSFHAHVHTFTVQVTDQVRQSTDSHGLYSQVPRPLLPAILLILLLAL